MNRLKREITQMVNSTQRYDILIVDASHKQSARSARNLGRAGLQVALAASVDECTPSDPPPAFRSKYSGRSVMLPSYSSEPTAYVDSIIEFVRQHHPSVVLPTGDASIALLAPRREELAELGCTLAVASDAVLEIANDKTRTLEVADKLGIAYPRSIQVDGPDDLPGIAAEFGFPFVLKPT